MARQASIKEEFASAVGCCQVREDKEAAIDNAVIKMGGMEDRSPGQGWSQPFSARSLQDFFDTSVPPKEREMEAGGDVAALYERARRTVRTLEQERNTQQLELQKSAQELAELRAEQAMLLDEVEKCMPLEARFQEAQRKIQILKDERDSLRMQAVRGSQSPKGNAPEQVTAQLQEALKQIKALQAERSALRFQAEASAKAVVDLEAERSALAGKFKRSAAAAEQSEAAQQRVIALVQEERDAERRRGSEVSMQRQKIERQLKDVEQGMDAMRMEMERSGQEAAKAQSQLHVVQLELHAARKQVEEADEAVSRQDAMYTAQLEEANAQIKSLQANLDAGRQNQKAGIQAPLSLNMKELNLGGQKRITSLTLSQILTDITTKLNCAEASWNPWTDITELKEQTANLQATLRQSKAAADQITGA